MSKPDFEKMDEEMAKAFATDAYRQMTEITQDRDRLMTYLAALKLDHDLAEPNDQRCKCEICRRFVVVRNAIRNNLPICETCLARTADGMHHGKRICAECLDEQQQSTGACA